MEWWQPIVSFASVAAMGIAGYSLKVLMDIRVELAGNREWRKQVDERLGKGENRMDRHSGALRQRGYRGSQTNLKPVDESI